MMAELSISRNCSAAKWLARFNIKRRNHATRLQLLKISYVTFVSLLRIRAFRG